MRGEQYLEALKEVYFKAEPKIKKHSTTILTGVAVVGVAATAISAVKATPKALKLIEEAAEEKGSELSTTQKFVKTAPVYLPTVVIGASTMACIVGAQLLNKKQQAALTGAYALLSASYNGYRDKVTELFGDEANGMVKHAIAKEQYNEEKVIKPVGESESRPEVDKEFEDTVLFFDEYRNQFFETTLEHVKDAEYHLNRNFALRDYAELNEFYAFLGLPPTELGAVLGWSIYAGEDMYGYQWIDFNHVKDVLDDGTEYYRLEMPFSPTADYLEY